MKAFVIGAGTMGSGIVQVLASNRHEVYMCDTKEEFVAGGYTKIEKGLERLVEKGKLDEGTKRNILSNITTTTDLAQAKECDLVIEAIFEDLQAKKELFSKLDAICKAEAIFASNTSSLSITEIARGLKRSEQVIGMHFFNPAPVMKLVELIRGMATSDATFNTVRNYAVQMGKEPMEVKEGPGFVVNRILIPMINEAVGILAERLATAEDIDKAMMLGASHPIGPLALADFVGNDVNLAIMEVLYCETGDPKYRPHPLLRQMVRAGYLGRKTGRGFFAYGQ